MDRVEPRSANDYNDRTTSAVRSVLVEIGQILGSFEGKFAVIGGAVPWLLLSQAEMAHVGTADVDPNGRYRQYQPRPRPPKAMPVTSDLDLRC